MAHRIHQKEWTTLAGILDSRHTNDIMVQQRLFRLFQAMTDDELGEADAILKSGVPLDLWLLRDNQPGSTPGADVFVSAAAHPEDPGITLLAYAARCGRMDWVEWILQRGATVQALHGPGRDAAWVAMEAGQVDIYRALMDAGASPRLSLAHPPRFSRLMAAVCLRNAEVVADLLHRRAPIGHHDAMGRTALAWNLRQSPYNEEDATIARMLIAAGADVLATDNEGINPIDLMVSETHEGILNEFGIQRPKHRHTPVIAPLHPAPVPAAPVQEPASPAPRPGIDRRPAPRPKPP